MVEKSKLDKDKDGKAVDPSHYRSMIDTLLYITATFVDADHAGCQDTRRSTSGSIQLLGDRLTHGNLNSANHQIALDESVSLLPADLTQDWLITKEDPGINVNKLNFNLWRYHLSAINNTVSVGGLSILRRLRTKYEEGQCDVLSSGFTNLIPPKTKGSKKKADTDATTKQKPPTVPKEKKEKKSGKGKQKAKELEPISEAILTEAEQLKIITKRSCKETHSSHASGMNVDEIKMTIMKTAQDDERYDVHDDDKNAQNDDDEAQTESDDDGDDFIHPKLTTHDDEIIH
ncbi:hypothetical protein Tco_0140314 [Tanacetum coccineum]